MNKIFPSPSHSQRRKIKQKINGKGAGKKRREKGRRKALSILRKRSLRERRQREHFRELHHLDDQLPIQFDLKCHHCIRRLRKEWKVFGLCGIQSKLQAPSYRLLAILATKTESSDRFSQLSRRMMQVPRHFARLAKFTEPTEADFSQ